MHRAHDDIAPLTIAPTPLMKRRAALPLSPLPTAYTEPSPKTATSWLHRRGMSLIALIIITALGAFLRFYHLTSPPLWNDETLVFWRVCGTYGQMLVPLRIDGFPPLHYSLYWLVGHPIPLDSYVNQQVLGSLVAIILALTGLGIFIGSVVALACRQTVPRGIALVAAILFFLIVKSALGYVLTNSSPGMLFPKAWSPGQRTLWLTPWVIRAIPAIFGTLTVPAIYFLARQILPRDTSLIAAMFTACSAFMLFYSRDGKMYADSWLFVTLNLGCLLCWFRNGSHTAWLGWIAAGCAMVGLQPTSLTIPLVSTLLVLTQRHFRWKKLLLFVVGLVFIYAGPIGYYSKFNVWNERVEEVGWSTSGLGWVGNFFNGPRTGLEHYQYASSAFLIGYEWPRDDYVARDAERPIPDALITGPETAFVEIACILALGLLPWPLKLRSNENRQSSPESGWRVYLWIAGIILPVSYTFYCLSVTGFVSPWRWWYNLREWLDWEGFAGLGAIALTFFVYNIINPRRWATLLRFLQYTLVTATLIGICMVIYRACASAAAEAFFQGKPWQSVWTPRYLGTLWPVACLGVAALLMRLPTRPVRVACILFVLAVNLGMFSLRLTLGTEPPMDIQAHDEWLAQDINGKPSKVHTFDYIAHGGIAVAESAMDANSQKVTVGRYYLVNDSGGVIVNDPQHRPMSPNVFARSLSYFHGAGIGFNLRQDYNWWQFRQDIASSPQLERVITWTRQPPRGRERQRPDPIRPVEIDNDAILQAASSIGYDPIRRLFPAGWKLSSEKSYTVHNPWDWRTFAFWIRREYVKTPSPPVVSSRPKR